MFPPWPVRNAGFVDVDSLRSNLPSSVGWVSAFMKLLLSFEDMGLSDDQFLQFCVCPRREVSISPETSQTLSVQCEDAGGGPVPPHSLGWAPALMWDSLEAGWFSTSVSLAAVAAFHDSALHYPKHVIAFEDSKRTLHGFRKHPSRQCCRSGLPWQKWCWDQTRRSVQGGAPRSSCLDGRFCPSKDRWMEICPQYRDMMENGSGRWD